MNLETDPFEIESWEDYAKLCRDAGELWRFKKALSEYIWITNRPCEKEIREYCNRRRGEWFREEIERKKKLSKAKDFDRV